MPSKIEVTPEFEAIAIRLNGVLHLWLDRKKLLGLQSWIMLGRRQYFIEFIMDGGNLTVDYDTREKWEAILKQIEPLLLASPDGSR